MDTTTTNYIEAKNIGRVASRAGFTVRTHSATRIRGWHHYSEGFTFEQYENGWIRVDYKQSTSAPMHSGIDFTAKKVEKIAAIRSYFQSKGYEIAENSDPSKLRVRKAK